MGALLPGVDEHALDSGLHGGKKLGLRRGVPGHVSVRVLCLRVVCLRVVFDTMQFQMARQQTPIVYPPGCSTVGLS